MTDEKLIAAEEAKRKELEGKGWSKADFEANPKNYLVEAGAGAGKTFIMVQRIVNQLVTGVYEPEDIVAITFTNKSTLELRERLDKELVSRRNELLKQQTLTHEEQQTLRRLEYLMQESGRMQVSTIHSFCNTMLTAMPFASPLGMDMQLLKDEKLLAQEFLRRKMRQNRKLFRKARAMGYSTRLLMEDFVSRCKNGEAEVVYNADPVRMEELKAKTRTAVIELQQELAKVPLTANQTGKLDPHVYNCITMSDAAFSQDETAMCRLVWARLSGSDKVPTGWGKDNSFLTNAKAGKQLQAVWVGPKGMALQNAAAQLLHGYVMGDMVPLLEEYRAEKTRRHIATFNDLLLRARDMLRDDADARAYFHERYKVLYVDEMQDTDPVQAEFLFYLTTDEKDFDGTNWQNCKPMPGSLFLVGDPKQAIYRFRGADIDVYNTLLRLFRGDEEGSVGEKVVLRFNFRSAAEICTLSDQIFMAPADPAAVQSHHFVGGKHHAEYVSMIARNGACPRARTVYYQTGSKVKENDPRKVAAFIRTMIDLQIPVGVENPKFKKFPHPAEAKDFLILTSGKKSISTYSAALNELDIPVQVTGEKSFEDTAPIGKAVLHLRSLLDQRNDPLLIRVLHDCYDVRMETLRVFLQRTGLSLTSVVKKPLLRRIYRALKEESPCDKDLLALCTALQDIAGLRESVKKKPAMAVIEDLLEGGHGVWKDCADEDQDARRQIFSEVQQYLNLVRSERERSFPALADYAIACAEETFEQELDLEPAVNAVRIMNLHKAKGLEAEIVILAASWQMERVPDRHMVRDGNDAREYVSLIQQDNYERAPKHQVGYPENWNAYREEERKYLEAEYARLLYVAATRAKTMLVVFERDELADNWQKRTPSYWDPMIEKLDPAAAGDPQFGPAFYALQTGVVVAPQPDDDDDDADDDDIVIDPDDADDTASDDADDGTGLVVFPLQPEAMEARLREQAAALAVNSVFPITPSKLDKHPDAAESAVKVTTSTGTAAEEVHKEKGPFGADWGTMVHRVMELCVREGSFRATALEEAARQAVREQLDNGFDTDHLWRLGLRSVEDEEAVLEKLVPEIEVAAAFLTSEITSLRQLIDGGACYPELPFVLQAEKDHPQTGELYRHLSAHISDERAADRTLAVEGIIDLAIRKDDGWYVVDYKTDRVGGNEDKDAYMQRLKGEYTAQITAYARVLEKMNGEKSLPVKGAWLCSIHLGGELIKLDIAPKGNEA